MSNDTATTPDLERARAEVRIQVTKGLVFVFAIACVAIIASGLHSNNSELVQLGFTGLMGLTTTCVGFWFGGRGADKRSDP